jgi:ribose/xylose/arabinose/galactoside ABC-type transport system permease subunit
MVMLLNGLYKFAPSPAYQYLFQGIIILVAIFFDSWFNRVMAASLMKKTEAAQAAAKMKDA